MSSEYNNGTDLVDYIEKKVGSKKQVSRGLVRKVWPHSVQIKLREGKRAGTAI